MASSMSGVVKKIYGDKLSLLSWPKRKWIGIKTGFRKFKRYLDLHPSIKWITNALILICIVASIIAVIMSYNRFAQLLTRSDALNANLGKEFKRRHNLIPNLIAVTREYTIHESDSFKYISDAREKYTSAKGLTEKFKAAKGIESALSKLFALFEQYPDLKATQSAQDLIKELTITENRVADAKALYNENSRAYNQMTSSFPGRILYRIYGYPKSIPYLSVDDELVELPEVKNLRKSN